MKVMRYSPGVASQLNVPPPNMLPTRVLPRVAASAKSANATGKRKSVSVTS
jgi:hypothetical protein